MEKSEKKQEQPPVRRRTAGARIFQPPTPRPIPPDHPAKSLFTSLPREPAEDLATPTETTTATPIETTTVTATTPTVTATETTTATPTAETKVGAPTSPPRRVSQPAASPSSAPAPDDAPRAAQTLDATHTSSEQLIYSYMYRETITKGIRERHFGPKELMKATPIRSHVTVRKAIDGLIEKLSIEIVSYVPGSPFGPRYRVYEPREINRRRAAVGIFIDPGSKRIVPPAPTTTATPTATPTVTTTETAIATPTTPTATPTNSVGATATDSGGVTPTNSVGAFLNRENSGEDTQASAASSSQSGAGGIDDEAFTQVTSMLNETAQEILGREVSGTEAARWRELAELLTTELKLAAGRTGSVSNVPAFLTEHLRRRLWKKDKRQVEAEAAERREEQATKVDASRCPDCFGTGMWYPEGFEKGVARCRHEKLAAPTAEPPTEAELVTMFTGFLHQGMSAEELDGPLSAAIDPELWPRIRQAALERYEHERGQMRPPGQS